MKFPRFYQNLDKYLKPNKVLVIYGARQVGKTTLLNNYLSKTSLKYKLDSGDNIKTQNVLSSGDFKRISEYAAGYELIAIDEAQRIPNIGQGLKILADQIKGLKIIATGSSSFELSGQIGEPLTGRKETLILFPLSQLELRKIYNSYELKEMLEDFLVFGSYPAVLSSQSKKEKVRLLEEIANSYLLKDIFELEKIRASKILLDLLRLLAFQIGSEVSFSELGEKTGLDSKTIARYLDLLEKSFVIYNLRGFSKNLRKEITKKGKYYFYDNGIRNAIISNFNPLKERNDIGQLWENFLISERLKTQHYKEIYANNYFWRTWDQKEIDWIEEREGKLFAYEFKFKETKIPKSFKEFRTVYPEAKTEIISQENYLKFLMP